MKMKSFALPCVSSWSGDTFLCVGFEFDAENGWKDQGYAGMKFELPYATTIEDLEYLIAQFRRIEEAAHAMITEKEAKEAEISEVMP